LLQYTLSAQNQDNLAAAGFFQHYTLPSKVPELVQNESVVATTKRISPP